MAKKYVKQRQQKQMSASPRDKRTMSDWILRPSTGIGASKSQKKETSK